jgi:hypothetical protein
MFNKVWVRVMNARTHKCLTCSASSLNMPIRPCSAQELTAKCKAEADVWQSQQQEKHLRGKACDDREPTEQLRGDGLLFVASAKSAQIRNKRRLPAGSPSSTAKRRHMTKTTKEVLS